MFAATLARGRKDSISDENSLGTGRPSVQGANSWRTWPRQRVIGAVTGSRTPLSPRTPPHGSASPKDSPVTHTGIPVTQLPSLGVRSTAFFK